MREIMVHAIAVATWRVVNPGVEASGFTRSAKCLPACIKTSASCMLQPVVNKLVSQSGSATGQRRTGLLVMFFRTMGENVAEGMREVSIVTSMCLQYATVSLDELTTPARLGSETFLRGPQRAHNRQ